MLTFDPRHGSTCHPDHRAAAAYVLEAANQSSKPPIIYLLETFVTGTSSPLTIQFSPGAAFSAGAFGFDANGTLKSRRSTAWQFTVWTAQTHGSQFEPAAVRGLSKFPSRQRVVYLAPAIIALASEPLITCR